MDIMTFWTVTLGIMIAIVAVFFLYMETKYKYRLIVKDVVKHTVLVRQYRARRWTDSRDKTEYLKLAGEKDKERKLLTIPPEESLEIDHKGRKYAECYRFETGEIVWIKDDYKAASTFPTFDELPPDIQAMVDGESDYSMKKEIKDIWRKKQVEQWKKDNKIIAPYQPITTNQRGLYFNNIKKAELRKQYDWKQNILPITAIGGIVLIVLGLMIFWGEIAKPALEAGKIAENMQKSQQIYDKEMLILLKEIKLGQQSITSNTQPPPTAPD